MKTHKTHTRRRPSRTIMLAVEALEPRVVLSAAGFGFDGPHQFSDFHHRDHEPPASHGPVFAEQIRDSRGDERFLSANRIEFNMPMPRLADPARGGRGDFEFGRRDFSRDYQSKPPVDNVGKAEGEAPPLAQGLGTVPKSPSSSEVFRPITTAIYVVLTPNSSPPRGSDLLDVVQPVTRVAQPTRSVASDTGSQPSDLSGTVPVTVPVSLASSTRTTLFMTSDAAPSTGRFDFTSFANDNEFVRMATTPTADLSRDAVKDRVERIAEESIWTDNGEGGFIEMDLAAADNSRERFEFDENSDDVASIKRSSSEAARDAFWFDFDATRLRWMLDSQTLQDIAAEQSCADAAKADEEAWLLDDGGMIVLTSSQFIEPGIEVPSDEIIASAGTNSTTSGEIAIPMDTGIGVFQAVEVASAPAEWQGDKPANESAPAPIKVDEMPVQNSEGEQSGPMRAAATPMLLAIAALFARGRKRGTVDPIVERDKKCTARRDVGKRNRS